MPTLHQIPQSDPSSNKNDSLIARLIDTLKPFCNSSTSDTSFPFSTSSPSHPSTSSDPSILFSVSKLKEIINYKQRSSATLTNPAHSLTMTLHLLSVSLCVGRYTNCNCNKCFTGCNSTLQLLSELTLHQILQLRLNLLQIKITHSSSRNSATTDASIPFSTSL